MRPILALAALVSAITPAVAELGAQSPRRSRTASAPSRDSLAGITRRGRTLAEHDRAARLGAEAARLAAPPGRRIHWQLARKTERGWEVAFGRLAPASDTFFIEHVAMPGIQAEWAASSFEPAQPDTGYFLRAGRAIETALAMFPQPPARDYAATAVPADDGPWWWVYVYPAADERVWPLGDDVRFRVSADGRVITETRHLHAGMTLYTHRTARTGSTMVSSSRPAVPGDTPEDTDVTHVLQRRPALPEFVSAGRFRYRIDVDGSIRRVEARQ